MAYRTPEPSLDALTPQLSPVASTLLIPLAARAHGERLFPHMAVHDAHAQGILARLHTNVTPYLQDPLSVYGVLSRTRLIQGLAADFFKRHPRGWGANLGCGLSSYFQGLDNGRNHWLDADQASVVQLRQEHLPLQGARHHQVQVDLRRPHWWQTLGLPQGARGQAVLVILEGVLMYQTPAEVQSMLREFAQHAPPGSELICDTLSWMAVGAAASHPSVGRTQAQFHWGPRHMSEFTQPHPRLRLQSEHAVLNGFGPACSWMCTAFRALWGVPVYGLVRLSLKD
jgi:O-methyltransferase involved in polyketide biosynthesis